MKTYLSIALLLFVGLSSCAESSEADLTNTETEMPSELEDATQDEPEMIEPMATEEAETNKAELAEQKEQTSAKAKSPKVKTDAPISYKGPGQLVAVETRLGRVIIKLHDETPEHRDNFIKLASEGFFDGTTFHRIMEGFMVQGGDPLSKDPHLTNDGEGGPGYTVPAEFDRKYYHKKGAVAAARRNDAVNPERESNGSQFYIVHGGNEVSDELFAQWESVVQERGGIPDFTFSDEAKEEYYKNGGAPFLDMQYTVFGEVVEGMDVVEKMGSSETYNKVGKRHLGNQPTEKIIMTVKVVKSAS